MSRDGATASSAAKLLDLRDVTCDRLRRHQILVAGCCRYFSGVEMAACAIALQTFQRSWVPGSGIAFCHLFKRQGKVRVVGCRILSRQVATGRVINIFGCPWAQCSRCSKRRRCYPQSVRDQERTQEHALTVLPMRYPPTGERSRNRSPQVSDFNGGRTRIRTLDPLIKSCLLR